jgi:hypothetical protein
LKRPTPAERDKINQTAARVRRQRGAEAHAPAGDVEGAGLVHELPSWEVSRALRDRVFDVDAVATIRGGESAEEFRSNLGPLGLARGWAR